MGSGFVVTVMGVAIRVDTSAVDAETHRLLSESWSDRASLWHPSATVVVPASPSVDIASLVAALADDVKAAASDQREDGAVLLRASAIADERGRVTVILGDRAKEAARALESRFFLVGDEMIAIDREGDVTGVRSPRLPDEWSVTPERPAPPRRRLSQILSLERRERSAERGAAADLARLDDAEGVRRLVERSDRLASLREPLHVIAEVLNRCGGMMRIAIGDESDAAEAVADCIERDQFIPASQPDVESVSRKGGLRSESGTLYRAPVLDAIGLDGGRMIILAAHARPTPEVIVLDAAEAAVWRHAEGAGEDELKLDAIEPSAAEAALSRLVTAELLVSEPGWRLHPQVVWTDTGRCAVVLPLADGSAVAPFVLEGSGYVIWAILSAAGAIEENLLIDLTAEQFDVLPDAISHDVRVLMRSLFEKGAVLPT